MGINGSEYWRISYYRQIAKQLMFGVIEIAGYGGLLLIAAKMFNT